MPMEVQVLLDKVKRLGGSPVKVGDIATVPTSHAKLLAKGNKVRILAPGEADAIKARAVEEHAKRKRKAKAE